MKLKGSLALAHSADDIANLFASLTRGPLLRLIYVRCACIYQKSIHRVLRNLDGN